MNAWVLYDIESSPNGDRRRQKIAKQIQRFGLMRIQKSVFCGALESNRLDELILFSRNLIEEKVDSVYIFPMCDKDYNAVTLIGQGFDKDLVANRKRELFL